MNAHSQATLHMRRIPEKPKRNVYEFSPLPTKIHLSPREISCLTPAEIMPTTVISPNKTPNNVVITFSRPMGKSFTPESPNIDTWAQYKESLLPARRRLLSWSRPRAGCNKQHIIGLLRKVNPDKGLTCCPAHPFHFVSLVATIYWLLK